MLVDIFNSISEMLYSSSVIALAGSFLWGIASIVLSPCHLTSIPLVIGYIDKQGIVSTGRAALIASCFSTGILISIGLVGLITGILGRMLGDIGPYGNIIAAVILMIIGLYLLDIIRLPFLESGISQPEFKKKSLFTAFLLGLLFGLALGPCTFAYMAPMLGIVFSVAATNIVFAVSLIAAYAIGHCLVIIFAGGFTEAVSHLLKWNEESKAAVILKKVCGILVIITGLYILFFTIKIYFEF